MDTQIVTRIAASPGTPEHPGTRDLRCSAPRSPSAGSRWAFVQPYRLTLLHPHGQGFWWLVDRAAAARRRRRRALRARRRPPAPRRPGGRQWSPVARWCTGCSRRAFLLLGLIMLAEAIVGEEVWRAAPPGGVYLWPGIALRARRPDVARDDVLHELGDPHGRPRRLGAGADGRWARAELGLATGKLHSRWWRLAAPVGLVVSGAAFLVHEQNSWYFARSAFLHHLIGWTLDRSRRLFPLALVVPAALGRRSRPAFALTIVALAVMLFSDRDLAPVFGHLSPLAGAPHR